MSRASLAGLVAGAVLLLSTSSELALGTEPSDELNPDAAGYASLYPGVSLLEADRRLRLQVVAGELDASLMAAGSDWFGGLWLEHQPDFKVVVFSTKGQPQIIASTARALGLEGMVEIRPATYPYAELERALGDIRELDTNGNAIARIDVLANRVEVRTRSRSEFESLAAVQGTTLPAEVAIVEGESLYVTPIANIFAGLTLTYTSGAPACTSGYSIRKQITQVLGVTTAAHCDNTLKYGGVVLPFQSAYENGSTDAQWHTPASYTVKNWASDGIPGGSTPGYRIINAKTTWANQPYNAVACRYGWASLYACGNVISKIQRGAMPNPNSTTIWLANSHSDDLASPGDSGGPVFAGNSAWGIMHACISADLQCDDPTLEDELFYIAENFVEADLGVTILTAAP